MAPSSSPEPLLVQIPPRTSPVLLPSHRSRSPPDDFTSNYRNRDIPTEDELEFIAPGQWDDDVGHFVDQDDDEGDSEEDTDVDNLDLDDDDIDDWRLEDGHIEGVPCANTRLDAKHFQTPDFLDTLLHLLSVDLAIDGWSTLPRDTPSSLIQIHRVSGSFTNAVFFVSIPETDVELAVPVEDQVFAEPEEVDEPVSTSSSGDGTPLVSSSARLFPATVFSELERGRQAAATPTPGSSKPASTVGGDSAPATPLTRHLPPVSDAAVEDDDEDDHLADDMPGALPLDPSPSPSPTTSRRPSEAGPPRSHSQTRTERTLLSAPTLLLRIYGPQTGSLISRRNELHILHTLSSQYGISAHVLGTFANGRVEEYFNSRPLTKEEMRDPRVSRWIGRRMRELHSVELEQMVLPPKEGEEEAEAERRRRSRSRSGGPDGLGADGRPGPQPVPGGGNRSSGSGASIYSTSSSSSVFSFGPSSASSTYSSYSARSSSTIGSGSGSYTSGRSSSSLYGSTPTSLVSSPDLLPHRSPSEGPSDPKKRSRRHGGSASSRSSSRRRRSGSGGPEIKLSVWENITRWTREARSVLKELDELAHLPGFDKLLAARSGASTPSGPRGEHVQLLSHPALTAEFRSAFNLPLFEQQLRLYRTFVRRAERGTVSLPPLLTSSSSSSPGPSSRPTSPHPAPLKSKRVFAHNDTQYGNLLLITPNHPGDQAEEEEIERQARREGGAHRRLIVVDFEYAGANARGFDIANHFCEWQADYHHPSLAHSLSAHQPYPTYAERVRFLRAYVGCDGGLDSASPSPVQEGDKEDPRVARLLDEVRVWQPSSHALWATWGIVQGKDDLVARIAVWKERAARVAAASSSSSSPSATASSPSSSSGSSAPSGSLTDQVAALDLSSPGEQQKAAEEMATLGELDDLGEVFDYLAYAAERMRMFRRELGELGIV
ncbi:hypothetical protein JCM8097_005141 [Rhodosporidiobolus ruineniae]